MGCVENKHDDPDNNGNEKIIKDSPSRSIAKAITWRVLATSTTFIITFVIFRRYTDKTLNEVLETSSLVAIFESVSKLILYYFHERFWTNIRWGKYWTRHYWTRRAWRKLYRKLHKEQAKK